MPTSFPATTTAQWNVAWEPLFARKFVRRLWGEEIHDAVVQSSGVMPTIRVTGFSDLGFPTVAYAMQLPDTVNVPGGAINAFLDSFLRGNRDDQPRREPTARSCRRSSLMNDNFIMTRIDPGGIGRQPTAGAELGKPNEQLINALYPGRALALPERCRNEEHGLAALAGGQSGGRRHRPALVPL